MHALRDAQAHPPESKKRPIIGVNTFRNPHGDLTPDTLELARSTDEEKQNQLKRLDEFHAAEAPAMLNKLQQAVINNGNVLEVLMEAVRVCSLGQITSALFEVGGDSTDSAFEPLLLMGGWLTTVGPPRQYV